MPGYLLSLPALVINRRRSAALVLLAWLSTASVHAGTPDPAASAPSSGPAPSGPTTSSAAPAAASAEVRFAFSDATLRLPTAQEKGTVVLLITAEAAAGKELSPSEKITVVDAAPPDMPAGSPKVAFDVVAEQQSVGKVRAWYLQARVESLAVNSGPLSRTALVTLGGFQRTLSYVLTNRPASAPDFTLVQPAPWSSADDDVAAALLVSSGDQPLHGLRLAHAALADKAQGANIQLQALALCTTSTGPCVAPPTIPAGSAQTVYLRFKQGQRPLGRFTGTVSLAVDARADAKSVSLEVNATSHRARIEGALLVLAGVLVALGLTGWARTRVQRLAALQPVVAARERVERLISALDPVQRATGVPFERIRSRFGRFVAEDLDESLLDREGMLPRRWSLAVGGVDMAALQTRLRDFEPRIAGLAVAVREGALVLLARFEAVADNDPVASEKRRQIVTALGMLDDPDAMATEADAAKLVAQALQASVFKQAFELAGGAQGADVPPRAALSLQRISTEIDVLSGATWLVYAILTAVSGFAALVLTNPGFGSCLDFVYCLFWGFGMPVTLEKLQQLSPTQVGKSVGVSLPA